MQIEISSKVLPDLEIRAKELNKYIEEVANRAISIYFSSDDYLLELAAERFQKIPSVRKVYLSPTNSIIVIQDENYDDRPKIYDIEQLLQKKIPSRCFTFFTATNEANYESYKKLYERREYEQE